MLVVSILMDVDHGRVGHNYNQAMWSVCELVITLKYMYEKGHVHLAETKERNYL